MENLWSAFVMLSKRRNYGMNGALPISFGQIRDFIELTGTPLTPREVYTIIALDDVFLRIMNGKS